MDFGFSEEQDLLRSTARDLLERRCPVGWVRRALDGAGGEPDGLWEEMARLGWTGIAVPEADGGTGGTFIDQVVLLEEMGRVLAPATYATTTCAAIPILATLARGEQRERWLAPLVAGSRRATVVAGTDRAPQERSGLAVRATPTGAGSTVLTGVAPSVLGAAAADLLVVAARRPDDGVGVWIVERTTPGVDVSPLHPLDPSRQLAHIRFDEVEVAAGQRLDGAEDAWPIVAAALDRLTVATCAELCGAGDRMLEMTVAYAKVREQFDRPIGSFQAVKHLCADMLLRLECSKAATYYAALCVDEGREEAALATSIAKAFAGENIPLLAEDAVQVHGGIGFTWEHDVHLYVRRAKTTEQLLGSVQWHRERVARLVGI